MMCSHLIWNISFKTHIPDKKEYWIFFNLPYRIQMFGVRKVWISYLPFCLNLISRNWQRPEAYHTAPGDHNNRNNLHYGYPFRKMNSPSRKRIDKLLPHSFIALKIKNKISCRTISYKWINWFKLNIWLDCIRLFMSQSELSLIQISLLWVTFYQRLNNI